MPSPRPSSQRIRGSFLEKSMSFHGRVSPISGFTPTPKLRRPKTLPNLPSAARIAGGATEGRPKLTKLLLNVTVEGSLGPVQVLVTPESTVGDLIAAAVRLYLKEGRRPVLPNSDPGLFDLHYSQFSLESLNRDEELAELGSRNFFLCKRKAAETTLYSSSKQAEEEGRRIGLGVPWFKLIIGFLQ